MTNELLYNIVLNIKGQNQVLASINGVHQKTAGMVANIQKQMGAIKLNAIIDQVNRVADGIASLNAPGMALGSSMKDLQAITGVTGQGLKQIEGYARRSALTFGGSAAQSVDSYKLLLSQLSPEIAKVPTALKSMGETVSYTSKMMGGDTAAATEVLTTAMNQYGIALDNPIKASQVMASMMNVMGAASQAGSAELPQIKAALENAGMAAKAAGVSFEETNAAIQILDKSGKKGSEGGVALRNVLATLGQGRFLPKDVLGNFEKLGIDINKLGNPALSLSQRLNTLKPLLNDSALLSATFGKENSNAAMALIGQTGAMDDLTKSIAGTNSMYEQAKIVMQGPEEALKRMRAAQDNFKISLFIATNGATIYATAIGETAQTVASLVPLYTLLTNSQKMATLWTNIVTGAQWLWNAALTANPVGVVVVGVGALIAAVAVCWNKFEGFRKVIFQGWEAMKLFGGVIKDYVVNRFKELLSGITGIGAALLSFFKGDWQKAWETGKKAIFDLSGAGSGAKAIGQIGGGIKGAMDAGAAKSAAYTKNHSTESTSKSGAGMMGGMMAPVAIPKGITPPSGIPGIMSGEKGGKQHKNKLHTEAKSTAESIATGGTKSTNITLTFKDLIGIQNYSGTKNTESEKAGEAVLDELLRAIATATTAGVV